MLSTLTIFGIKGEGAVFVFREQITYKDILRINKLCLLEGEPFGVVDENRIYSAHGNQFQPYPNNEQAFASMYKSLVINHGFLNGNKRTGVIALYIARKMIKNPLKISDEDLCELTYKIASEGGSQIPVEDIADKVFKKKPSNNELTKEFNIEELVSKYIKKHSWLMKELAK